MAQKFGVDTGGTFTDVVVREGDGSVRVHKLLSTPDDPGRAIVDGVSELRRAGEVEVVHGTTVATNALLERRGARTALVTTAGFEDLLSLGRQNRPDLYALEVRKPRPVIAPEDCFGVAERISVTGDVRQPIHSPALAELAAAVRAGGYEAVAVVLLHAWVNPAHEHAVRDALRSALPGVFVCASSDITREFREYERASTAAVNAYVGPVMSRYLHKLEDCLQVASLEIFESSGALGSVERVASFPVHTALSGPAGGVVGALECARSLGYEKIITFDMGGTSSDVSLCDGSLTMSEQPAIGQAPLLVPMLDIHTVGAGGGSIAARDLGGALEVGPESAGASPGPACYGRGGHVATVTDAHAVLGRLLPDRFLGGQMSLDVSAATSAVKNLADELELELGACARGILRVADAAMIRAIKVISLERGHDPRDFSLLSFGGAGGLHACRLAEALGMSRVIIPRYPGLLSAYGMLHAARERHLARTIMKVWEPGDEGVRAVLAAALAELVTQAEDELGATELAYSLELGLRYVGQSFALRVGIDWSPGDATPALPLAMFEEKHRRLYGWVVEGRAIELETIRLVASLDDSVPGAVVPDPVEPDLSEVGLDGALGERVLFGSAAGDVDAFVYERAELPEGCTLRGPCLITEYSGTTVVEPGWGLRVQRGHLVLEQGGEHGRG